MGTIEEPTDSFQSRLRAAMQMRNMSVNMLSSKSGISQNTIYIYLNPEKYHRESCPGSNNLEALAVALDVSMDWLWGRPVALMSWIPVSERVPSKEERKEWIDNNLDGIGYLYPCLVTRYSSINPDRTKNNPYVAKHYYDGEDFLNAGEEVCSEYIIAWMPLPIPYGKETT